MSITSKGRYHHQEVDSGMWKFVIMQLAIEKSWEGK